MLGNKYYIREGGRSYFIILDTMIPDENCKTLHDNMKVTFCVLYTIEGVCGVGGVPSLGRRPKNLILGGLPQFEKNTALNMHSG